MAASAIPLKHVATRQPLTCTLLSLAAAAARQSTMIDNNANPVSGDGWPAAMVYIRIKSGAAAPTAGKVYEVYLIRGDDVSASRTMGDDALGSTDAAITIENAQLLGTIIVTATASKNFYGVFDTSPLGPLGPNWGIAIKNATDQALSAGAEGDFIKEYMYYVAEAQ
jgi:hypothetical protein